MKSVSPLGEKENKNKNKQKGSSGGGGSGNRDKDRQTDTKQQAGGVGEETSWACYIRTHPVRGEEGQEEGVKNHTFSSALESLC